MFETMRGHREQQIAYAQRWLEAEGHWTNEEWRVLLSQHPVCVGCDKQWTTARVAEVDHIVRLVDGGTHWISNLRPLCHSCNQRRPLHLA